MSDTYLFNLEVRAADGGRRIEGYGAVFNQAAVVRGEYEVIAPTAFDGRLGDDVRALVNHNRDLILGRTTSGTLRLWTDSQGLGFEVTPPATSYARDLQVVVERGDVSQGSFGFRPGAEEFTRAPDGIQVRTHTSIARLLDVSVVTFPAYDGAEVTVRSLADIAATPDVFRVNRSRLIRRDVQSRNGRNK